MNRPRIERIIRMTRDMDSMMRVYMFPNEGTYVRRLTNPVSLAHEPMFISSRTYVLQITGGQSPCEENNYGEMLARYESFVQTSLQTIGKDLDIVTRLTKD